MRHEQDVFRLGREDDDQRVERGLYVCKSCDTRFNADVSGAEKSGLISMVNVILSPCPAIGAPAGWHSSRSTCTTSPVDSNPKRKWWAANSNIPALEVPPSPDGKNVNRGQKPLEL